MLRTSCKKESVGGTLLFNTHFIVVLHPDIYDARLPSIACPCKEAVKAFYLKLRQLQSRYEEITPVSANWYFKFGPGAAFNGEVLTISDIKLVGMLAGLKDSNPQVKNCSHG